MDPMVGGIIIAVVLIVVIPVGFLVTMGAVAALLGQTTKTDVDRRYEGTEYLELS